MKGPKRVTKPSSGSGPARVGGRDVSLFTLGGVRLVRGETDETSKLGAKHLALLIYIFHEQRPMHPSEVIDLLGKGQDGEMEMDALRRAVTYLQERVPGVGIRLTSETLEALAGLRVDTHDVDSAIDGGDAACVAELYVGDFLEGFDSGCPAFDEWAQRERGRIKRAWDHAIVAAAQEAELRGRWEAAAQWWGVMVAHAPLRADAVAGLLTALALSKQGAAAARAYADYHERLLQSGVAQPDEAVKTALARHQLLRDVVEGRVEPAPAARRRTAAPRVAPSPPPKPPPLAVPLEPEPLPVELADVTPTVAPESPPAPAAREEAPRIDYEIVQGFQSGAQVEFAEETPSAEPSPEAPASPGGAAVSGFVTSDVPQQQGAWEEIVDLSEPGEFDIPVSAPKKKDRAVPAEPARPRPPVEKAAWPAASAGATRKPARPRLEDLHPDDPLRQAHAAAKEFEVSELRSVRHEVTAVRKPWAPVLKETWEELAPWREKAAEWARSVALLLLRALAALPGLLLSAVRRARGGMSRASAGTMEAARARLERVRARRAQRAQLDEVFRERRDEARTVAPREVERVEAGHVEVAAPRPAPRVQRAAPDSIAAEAPAFRPKAAARPREWALPRWRPRIAVMPLLRRYWYAPVGAAVVALAVAFGPWLFGLAKGFASGLPGKLPDVEAPRITLPKVDLPSVTIHTPSFVETAVSRIGQRLSGPLLSRPGEWLLVADVQLEGEAGFAPTPAALGLAIETDLAQARFFSVVPRERALIARRARGGAGGESLPLADALALARAEHYAVVVVPWARRVQGVDSLALRLLSPAGDTLYGVTAAVSEQGRPLETLADLLRAVRRRLGEPGGDVEASLEPSRFLTGSTEALELYAQARWHEFAGRHAQAIRAARQAVSRDSSFALAYYLLAQAQALSGQRPAARSALEMAWRFSERTTVRERMRIRGDWLVWENRQPDAAVTYDDLFSLHRDDVGALKSQAIVQRVIGARGSGEGNLKVAYTIDPYDWPPLSRIARFLGYNGRLPDVDSLVAAIQAGR